MCVLFIFLMLYLYATCLQFVHNGQPQVYNTTARNNPSTNLTYGVSKLNLFQLRKISSTSIEAIYSTKQIVLLMQFYPWSGGILSFEIQIPRSLCNDPNTTISGHLGNCDGNAKNDYVPNSHGETLIICNNTIKTPS